LLTLFCFNLAGVVIFVLEVCLGQLHPYNEGDTLTHEAGHGLVCTTPFRVAASAREIKRETLPPKGALRMGAQAETHVRCWAGSNHNFMDYSMTLKFVDLELLGAVVPPYYEKYCCYFNFCFANQCMNTFSQGQTIEC
jgi:hypothetical protein